ncbi:nickel insertion protein [Desulfovibrio sp. QI0442]
MKILYYDCFAGVSGDMNLAALIDLGVSPDYLKAELAKLAIDDEFALQCQPEKCNGIQGMQVHVHLNGQQHGHSHSHEHTHGHDHTHACAPAHVHGHSLVEAGYLPHRNLADVTAIIMQSALADPVKQTSLSIFRRIAEAEAKVHGKSLEDVHFHEVGATDSIVDIVGAAICFHALGVDAVWSSPLELGGGFVHCAHGMVPVPAPATVEILHGIPTSRGGVEHEATTPTGAAIIAALVDAFTAAPVMTTLSTGYGIGHRRTERPNMLRVHLAEVDEAAGAGPAR